MREISESSNNNNLVLHVGSYEKSWINHTHNIIITLKEIHFNENLGNETNSISHAKLGMQTFVSTGLQHVLRLFFLVKDNNLVQHDGSYEKSWINHTTHNIPFKEMNVIENLGNDTNSISYAKLGMQTFVLTASFLRIIFF